MTAFQDLIDDSSSCESNLEQKLTEKTNDLFENFNSVLQCFQQSFLDKNSSKKGEKEKIKTLEQKIRYLEGSEMTHLKKIEALESENQT
jgi:hypothetical protein